MPTFNVKANWKHGFKQEYDFTGSKKRPFSEAAFLDQMNNIKTWSIIDENDNIVLKKGDKYESA